MDQWDRSNLATGASAGLLAGFASGTALYLLVEPATGTLPALSNTGGLILHLTFATLIGTTFAAVNGFQPRAYAALTSSGLLFGLLWWLLGPLTIVPLAAGELPAWTVAAASTALPLLVTYFLYGSVLGLCYYGLVKLRLRLFPEAATAARAATYGEQVRERTRRIVIAGGGFGGVSVAQHLEKALIHESDVEIVLISEGNYLLFTPMLAGVAAGSLEPQHIATPVRAALTWAKFIHGRVEAVDPGAKLLWFGTASTAAATFMSYDQLVLALGSITSYQDIAGAESHAFSFKSLDDATRLKNHVIAVLEQADAEPDPEERKRLLTFVAVGGGYSGVEVITELRDLVLGVLPYYPNIAPGHLRFMLIHSRDRLLPTISESLAAFALTKLRSRAIECALNTRVREVAADAVALSDGREIPCRTVVWTTGSRPNPLAATLAVEPSRSGALVTDEMLRVKGIRDIWAVGDCAHMPDTMRGGAPHPATAQHATSAGRHAAGNIAATLQGRPLKPFRFQTLGTLVPIGRRSAIAELRRLKFSGLLAWFIWRSVYLAKLPTLEKRIRVAFDWLSDLFFERDIVLTSQAPRRQAAGEQAQGLSDDREGSMTARGEPS